MYKHDKQPTNTQPNFNEELAGNEMQIADLVVDQVQVEVVKGGPAYLKLDGIDGEVIERASTARK